MARATGVAETAAVMLYIDRQPPRRLRRDIEVPPYGKPGSPVCRARAASRAAAVRWLDHTRAHAKIAAPPIGRVGCTEADMHRGG